MKPTKREYLYMAAALALVMVRFDDEPQITAAHANAAAERKSDLRPCDGLFIQQCAAGECWSPIPPSPSCTPGSNLTGQRALPAHILTSPL